jgi:hypothetical protein
MESLEKIVGHKLDAAVAVVLPIHRKLCRRIEAHSQALETLNVRPKLEEVEKEWTELKAARSAYLAE